MSTIAERIEAHKEQLAKAERHFHKHDVLRGYWNQRCMFHVDAIRNLEEKKVRQQPKQEEK